MAGNQQSLEILWVKSGPLHPLHTGGRRRTHAMLTELNRTHRITYLAMLPTESSLAPEESADPYAAEKIWVPTRASRKGGVAFLASAARNLLASRSPFVLDRYRNGVMRSEIERLDAAGAFDLIVCDFLTPAVNFPRHRRVPAVLFQHNIESKIWKRLAEEKKQAATRLYFQSQYRRMRRCEPALCARFDGVVTVSPEDAEFSQAEYGLTNVLGAVPTGVDTRFFCPPPDRNPEKGLIGFLGSMDWMPNIECVQYFTREILPAIRARHPGCRFRIIGRDPAPAVLRLAEDDPGIEVTGTVEDIRPHLDACELLVVPLRSGGGTRIKIFESLAQGVPVVSTRIGAEGLPVTHGKDILIADSPADFAGAAIRLLDEPETARSLAAAARGMLEAEHGWDRVADRFIDLCRKAL